MTGKPHYRTVWLSDIHLGCKDCKAEHLLHFLDNVTMDTLFLVGDIVDLWAMTKQFHWPEKHNQLFHKLISLPEKGTKVIYLPGNHDEPAQQYDAMNFGEIEIRREYVHETASGKRLLLIHGDQLDKAVCFGKFQSWIGDKGYEFLLRINRIYNFIRSKHGYPYWSLAGYIKTRIQGANNAISRYRNAALDLARSKGLDGIVCGHIHHPEIVEADGVTYYNDGDWIENCSALTEDFTGKIELTYWTHTSNNTQPFVPTLIPAYARNRFKQAA